MTYMNDYNIETALVRISADDMPNRFRLAETVANLAAWANNNSDGWAFWPKPARAAGKAMALIESRIYDTDATDAETTAALTPIKAFLTRQGVSHEGIVIPETTGTGIYGGGQCHYVFDGQDTDGTVFHHCIVHDSIEISPDAPCAAAQ